jgi:sirohydrochlorin ferrochelatase
MTQLLAVAYGGRPDSTDSAEALDVVESLMGQVRRRLGGVPVRTAYLRGSEPSAATAVAELDRPTVVLPLLLSGGTHTGEVLPRLVDRAAAPVRIARPLGPHPLLAAAMCQRLQAAGARRGDAVVLMAPGSVDADALFDTHAAGRLLASHWGAPVKVAHLGGAGTRVKVATEALWAAGHRRIVAAPYLLADGHNARKARAQASVAGCTLTADVLGNHRLLVELVVRRYRAAVGVTGSSAVAARVA